MRSTTGTIALVAGFAALVGGITVRALRPGWASYGDAATACGALALVTFLVVERQRLGQLASGRQMRYGANTLIYTIIVGAIVVGANWLAVKHPYRVDLTEEQLHTLSEQTVKVLNDLPREVTVTAFFNQLSPNAVRAREMLDLYQRQSGKLTTRLVDWQTDPALAEKMDVRQDETTIFESGGQKTAITAATEEAFTNAIIKVTRDEVPRVYLIEGDGEMSPDRSRDRGLSQAKEQLIAKTYQLASVNLAQVGEVPRDAAMVIVADPERPMPERSVTALGRYLDEGGRAMMLLDAQRDSGLAPLLGRYGIDLGDDLVIDPTLRMMGGPPEAIVVTGSQYQWHPITDNFPFTTYFILVRSASPAPTPPEGVTVRSLFECTGRGWSETEFQSGTVSFDPNKDRRGPISMAVAATWTARPPADAATRAAADAAPTPELTPTSSTPPATEASVAPDAPPSAAPTATDGAEAEAPAETADASDTEAPITIDPKATAIAPVPLEQSSKERFKEGRLVVVGDADWACDTVLPDPSTGNGPLFLNMVSWLTESEQLIAVPPKKPGNYQVKIPLEQGYAITLLSMVVLPGSILIYGITAWWRRRRR